MTQEVAYTTTSIAKVDIYINHTLPIDGSTDNIYMYMGVFIMHSYIYSIDQMYK